MPNYYLNAKTTRLYQEMLLLPKEEVRDPRGHYSKFALGCAERGDACVRLSGAQVTGTEEINVLIPRFPTCKSCITHGINNP